ncbi:hypothetical protein G6011_05989 [Alternaria panax]|uniref:Uncharacterized protein n=1 Tax=Alternaria panax TaxID=48097 RepID=A0AAD4FI37_9PLEO|nr:hypothetical protein G6011_05989 [Alternaria panax]
MGFVILPPLVPDISAIYDVYFAVLKDNILTRVLFPSASEKNLTDANSDFREVPIFGLDLLQAHTAHVSKYWKTSATQYTLKCIDTDTNKIFGVALCDAYIAPSDWKKGEIGWLEGKERERAEALVRPLWDTREKLRLNERYINERRGFKDGVKLYENMGIRKLKEKLISSDKPNGAKEDQHCPLYVWLPEGREKRLPKFVELA